MLQLNKLSEPCWKPSLVSHGEDHVTLIPSISLTGNPVLWEGINVRAFTFLLSLTIWKCGWQDGKWDCCSSFRSPTFWSMISPLPCYIPALCEAFPCVMNQIAYTSAHVLLWLYTASATSLEQRCGVEKPLLARLSSHARNQNLQVASRMEHKMGNGHPKKCSKFLTQGKPKSCSTKQLVVARVSNKNIWAVTSW